MSERIWKLETWRSEPDPYVVTSRTAKAFKAKADTGDKPSYFPRESTGRLSDVGSTWFVTEAEAWGALRERHIQAIERAKKALQAARTQLGMVESKLKTLQAQEGQATTDCTTE